MEAPEKDGEGERELYMLLDSAALENLEVYFTPLEPSRGSVDYAHLLCRISSRSEGDRSFSSYWGPWLNRLLDHD